jgi:hypothetical protein
MVCFKTFSSRKLKGLICTNLRPNEFGSRESITLWSVVVFVHVVAGVMGVARFGGVVGDLGHRRRDPPGLLKMESTVDVVDTDETLKVGETMPLRRGSSEKDSSLA